MEFLVIFIFCITFYIGASIYKLWQHQSLKKTRKGQDITTFIEYFSGEDISEYICLTTYCYLQKTSWISDFTVHPQDHIATVYGICEEDLVDTIVELAEMCNRQLPSDEEIENKNNIHILLVEDLVRFLSSLDRVK